MVQGRRGLPPEDDGEATVPGGARRSAASPPSPLDPASARRSAASPATPADPAPPVAARRSAASPPTPDEPAAAPRASEPERSAWVGPAALAVVLSLVIGILYLTLGRSGVAEPRPSMTVGPSPVTSDAAPVTTATASAPGEDPGGLPTGDDTATGATSQSPPLAASSEAEPGSVTPPPSGTATTAAPAGVPLDLGEATIVVHPGWQLYADEVVQDQRRLIRMRELTTDTRIQAVVLTTVAEELDQACLALMSDQAQGYTDVAESLAVTVQSGAGAEGVSCAFTGTRSSDGVPNKVEFTLVRRQADGLTLFFRDTIPAEVPEGSPVVAQLSAIECDAAATFAVTINACSVIPGPAGG